MVCTRREAQTPSVWSVPDANLYGLYQTLLITEATIWSVPDTGEVIELLHGLYQTRSPDPFSMVCTRRGIYLVCTRHETPAGILITKITLWSVPETGEVGGSERSLF